MATSKLVAQLNQHLLECGICLEQFKNPRALPCLHAFCEECLDKYSEGKRQILCPTCKQATLVPREGVCSFPAHFMVNNLQDALDKIQKIVMDTILCSNCNLPDKEAIVRCVDCKEFFCPFCKGSHDSLKTMEHHRVVSIEDLRSGKIMIPMGTAEDQKCLDHDGEAKQFYCHTCEEPICRDCTILDHNQHQFVSLKDESKMHVANLVDLAEKGDGLMKKYKCAVEKTEMVEDKLHKASKGAKKKLQDIKTEYHTQLDAIFKKHTADVDALETRRAKNLGNFKDNLQTQVAKVENACELASKVTEMGSNYDIASMYPALSVGLEEVTMVTEPESGEESLGFVDVETIVTVEIPDVVRLVKGAAWVKIGQIRTETRKPPSAIAIDKEGNVAITNGFTNGFKHQANIYSHDGSIKHIFEGPFDAPLTDITNTPDNRYVLPGKAEILFYNEQGIRLAYPKVPTSDMNNRPSNIQSLAVDSRGRIIAGLKDNTISIHHADGKLIAKFPTAALPRLAGLSVNSKGNIVGTFTDDKLRIMDCSGNIIKVVRPPHGVKRWEPLSLCCSKQGEIFVVNYGDPKAVYSCTADGDECLGCVITGLDYPSGIAITEDGQRLFVAERFQCLVKTFQRQ